MARNNGCGKVAEADLQYWSVSRLTKAAIREHGWTKCCKASTLSVEGHNHEDIAAALGCNHDVVAALIAAGHDLVAYANNIGR
jgi:hypothetical protein